MIKLFSKPLFAGIVFFVGDVLLLLCSYLFLYLSYIFEGIDSWEDMHYMGVILENIWWKGHRDIGDILGHYMFPVIVIHAPIPSAAEFFIFKVLCSIKFFFIGVVASFLFGFLVKIFRKYRGRSTTE
ncbi:hypothetical protein FACS1894116_08130 [Betaproteobacteria bacterium]|nr:hypothetical protein FACS1894116_08130 [Betaproteobacteria bacterium]